MSSKTSLEKSHSKASNAKLTFMCLIASISVSALWVGVMLIGYEVYKIFGIVLAIVGFVLTVISILFINKFTR